MNTEDKTGLGLPFDFLEERPSGIHRLDEFEEYLRYLSNPNLLKAGCVVGGMGVEINRRVFGGKHSEIESGDCDIRGLIGIIEALKKSSSFLPKPEKNSFDSMHVTTFTHPLHIGSHVVEVIDRLEGLDDKEAGGVLQGIETVQYPWGQKGTPVSTLDPLSLLLVKAFMDMKGSVSTDKVKSHILSTMEIIPNYLEYAAAAYEKGEIKRNPSVMAKRLLGDIHEKSSVYEGRTLCQPKLFKNLESACQHFAGKETEIYYHA